MHNVRYATPMPASLHTFCRIVRLPLLLAAGWAAACSFAAQPASDRPGAAIPPEVSSPSEERPITIGLVDTFSPHFYLNTVVPTFEHLMRVFGEDRIRIVELPLDLTAEGLKAAKLSFVVTSAAAYASFIDSAGTHQIATRAPKSSEDVAHTVASLFVTSPESDIRKVAEAKGRTVAISSRRSFDGWLIAQGELAKQGLDPDRHFADVVETRYGIPDVVSLVRSGIADVGVLGTCEYEAMLRDGLLREGDLRILDEKSDQEARPDACRRSTDRYPDVVFASLPNANSETANRVAVALLSMPSDRMNFRWTIANDFMPTLELLKTLRIGPFGEPVRWTPELVWQTYQTEIILFLCFCAAVLFHVLTLNVLVRRRTAELREAFITNVKLLHERNESRRRLLTLERSNIVSQLSNMFAHEIKQPIMNIACYAAALKMLLEREGALSEQTKTLLEKLSGEVDRSSAIVEHVRSYAKNRPRENVPCDLGEIVDATLQDLHDPMVTAPEKRPACPILADPFEIQFVVTNFIKNARSAVADVAKPEVTVSLRRDESSCTVEVCDNGPKLSDEAFEALGKVASSTKPDGLGFGLAIAVALAERNGGHLVFERRMPTGLLAALVLPLRAAGEKE